MASGRKIKGQECMKMLDFCVELASGRKIWQEQDNMVSGRKNYRFWLNLASGRKIWKEAG